jgi:hypothetical protein
MRWNFLLFTALYKTRGGVAAASAFKAAAENTALETLQYLPCHWTNAVD